MLELLVPTFALHGSSASIAYTNTCHKNFCRCPIVVLILPARTAISTTGLPPILQPSTSTSGITATRAAGEKHQHSHCTEISSLDITVPCKTKCIIQLFASRYVGLAGCVLPAAARHGGASIVASMCNMPCGQHLLLFLISFAENFQ